MRGFFFRRASMMPSRRSIVARMWRVWTAGSVVVLSLAACSPSSLVDVQTPSTVVDPSTVKTVTGALALRVGAFVQLMYAETGAYGYGVLGQSALFTDELQCAECSYPEIDMRDIEPNNNQAYADIYSARMKVGVAREALLTYGAGSPLVPRAWQGEMYALEGFTILWLAEQYCSGVPLTRVALSGVATPTRGYTTQELFTAAIALFDSAAVLGVDSAAYVNLALVGKGRAYLGLGQFAAADSAVASVPTNFVYTLLADSAGTTWGQNQFPPLVSYHYFRVQDHEGGNGLVWTTDPRTGVVRAPDVSEEFWSPAKYNVNASGAFDPTVYADGVPLRLADGLEARLIQAEAALARGDASWLTQLNTLRSDCVGATPCAPVPGLTSTTLAPLADPGTDTGRVTLVMQERAMWLYLTGHREGDLRRLARVYHRDPATLWPTGAYYMPSFPSLGVYGWANGQSYGVPLVFVPPTTEQTNNPLYSGCYDLNP